MRKFMLAAALLAILSGRAIAADAPAVLMLPSSVVSDLIAYLGTRPYGEVSKLGNQIQMCIAMQIPEQAAAIPPNWCQPVTDAIAAQTVLAGKPASTKPGK